MSEYYRGKRSRNLFDPASREPFRLSRSKVDLFLECSRCFYLDRRLGVGRPPGFPFSLNAAVDHLLKKEFDWHRAKQTAHPLMRKYQIDALPFRHPDLERWRDSLRGGVEYYHEPTNFLFTGGVDDIWQNRKGELIVVDYKATSKDGEVSLDAEWQDGYKRQMEFYQWLLRRNNFAVSPTGYFVYANGRRDAVAFDGKLEFDVKLIAYEGNDGWVEKTARAARECLVFNRPPTSHPDCDYCLYRQHSSEALAGLV